MKKFLYILMWIQLVFTSFISIFHFGWRWSELYPPLAVATDINIQWVMFLAFYIAWRVTPEPKQ